MNALQNYGINRKDKISHKSNCVLDRQKVIDDVNEIIKSEKKNGRKEEEVIHALICYSRANLNMQQSNSANTAYLFPLILSGLNVFAALSIQVKAYQAAIILAYLIIIVGFILYFASQCGEKARFEDEFILTVLEEWEKIGKSHKDNCIKTKSK